MAKRIYTYKDVNKAIKNVMGYMNSISYVWDKSRNLKLYEAFFKADDLIKKYPRLEQDDNGNDVFYDFCELEYYHFKEYMKENSITDPRVYVGRTSTFYLTNLHDKSPVYVLGNILNEVCGNIDLDFDENLKVCPLTWSDYFTEEELKEEYQWQFKYIITQFIYDVKSYMKDAIEVADYIDSFMKRQVEGLEEHMSFLEEELLWSDENDKKQRIEDTIQAGVEAIAYSI